MSLNTHYNLGNTGLKISRLCFTDPSSQRNSATDTRLRLAA